MADDIVPKKYFSDEVMITSPFWSNVLRSIESDSAIAMVERLDKNNPCGVFPGAHGVTFSSKADGDQSVMDTFLSTKLLHPEKIIVIRVGEFFEYYALDAVIAVEHCKLNPMGSKGVPKAGTPLGNLQSNLDRLTRAGFSVVVVEQADVIGKARKKRFISQILSPSSPIYVHSLALDDKRNTSFPEVPPIFGFCETKNGILSVEIYPDLKSTFISDGLTHESVMSKLEKFSSRLNKIYVHEACSDSFMNMLGHVSSESSSNAVQGSKNSRLIEKVSLVSLNKFVDHIELLVKRDLNLSTSFQFNRSNKALNDSETPRPLYLATAFQIGVLPFRGVPSLIDALLPKSAPVSCKSIIKDLLLSPPPLNVADAIRASIGALSKSTEELPRYKVSHPARFIRTISDREASASIMRELHQIATDLLNTSESSIKSVVSDLLLVSAHISGISANEETLLSSAEHIKELLTYALCFDDLDVPTKAETLFSNDDFYSDNESIFRGKVSPDAFPLVAEAYEGVSSAASGYAKEMSEILLSEVKDGKNPFVYDSKNSAMWMKSKPKSEGQTFIHPKDKNGRPVADRYSTMKLEEALSTYQEACEKATTAVLSSLRALSEELEKHSVAIIHLATFSTLMRTLILHVTQCKEMGWSINYVKSKNETLEIENFFPYWLKKDLASKNSISLSEVIILLGANASGKSSLLRSICSVSLLGSIGLMFPAKKISSPFIDAFFLRMGSSDDAELSLSAFAMEVTETSTILRDASSKSLVLIDELGKGTESNQGASFAGAVLEELSTGISSPTVTTKGIRAKGIFSTHWHELWDLSVNLSHIDTFHMETIGGEPSYRIKEGRIFCSLAFHAAKKLSFQELVLKRANEISEIGFKSSSIYSDRMVPPAVTSAPIEKDISAKRVKKLFLELSKTDESDLRVVKSGHSPGLGDLGKTCLYVLETPNGFFYVGETTNMRERLSKHEKTDSRKTASKLFYAVIKEGKGRARELETNLINRLLNDGFPLLSDNDGHHKISSESDEG